MTNYPFGAVYKVQREHSREHIAATLDRMKALGMNTVVIWPSVYWWEDPEEPGYPYATGHFILQHAGSIGMSVVMELAGQISALEYAPDFAMKDEYYATNRDGTPDNASNGFHYINYNHPEVKGLIREHYREAARQYKDYPALYGYDIWNETMFSSYDPHTMAVFREWLKGKYGTLKALNDAWDRSYAAWDQVKHETWLWASVMPYVDWMQFRKANIGMILKEWREAIRGIDPGHPVIADNIHSTLTGDDFYSRPQEDWIVAANTDEFGISFYPKGGWGVMPAEKRWRTFAGARASSGGAKSFWVSEMQTHHRAMFEPGSAVTPEDLRFWTWEAVVQGAKGIIYWKWEPFIKGIQTTGRGLVDYSGEPTPRAHETHRLSNHLNGIVERIGKLRVPEPKVAILYDSLSHDFQKAFTQNYREHANAYSDSIAGIFGGLWELGIPCTFVTPEDMKAGRMGGYSMIFVSMQICIDQALADAFTEYAENGGVLFCDGKFGEVGADGILWEANPGGPLNGSIGYVMQDVDAGSHEFDFRGIPVPGYLERKLLKATGKGDTTVVGTYADGYPGLLKSDLGKGALYYTPTPLWYGYSKNNSPQVLDMLKVLTDKHVAPGLTVDAEGVKAAILEGESGDLLVVFNYSSATREVKIGLGGRPTPSIHVRVEAQDVAVCVLEPRGVK